MPGNRHRPDGVELRWRQIGVSGMQADPQLPFVVCWESGPQHHPSAGASGDVAIDTLRIAGDPHRVREWLGLDAAYEAQTVDFTFVAPHGTPGLIAVSFTTPRGSVVV